MGKVVRRWNSFPHERVLFLKYLAFLSPSLSSPYQAWSVPEVLRPLYESSTVLAQKTTMAVRIDS